MTVEPPKLTMNYALRYCNVSLSLISSRSHKCPFPDHDDSSPSFKYFLHTDTFNCWGCSRGGGGFQFILYYLQSSGVLITYEELAEKLNDTSQSVSLLESLLLETPQEFDFESYNIELSAALGYYLRQFPHMLPQVERLAKELDLILGKELVERVESFKQTLYHKLSTHFSSQSSS